MSFSAIVRKAAFSVFLVFSIFQPAFAQDAIAPVFSSSEPPPFGLYLTANDYLAMKPRETEVIFHHVPQSEGEGMNFFFRKKENGKRGEKVDPGDYFAASDGKTYYVSYGKRWRKATKTDGEYSFVAYLSSETMLEADSAQGTNVGFSMGGNDVVGTKMTRKGLKVTSISGISLERPYRMKFAPAEGQWLPFEQLKSLNDF